MISPLTKKNQKSYFNEGKFEIEGISCLLAPINTVAVLFHYLKINHYRILKKQLDELAERFSQYSLKIIDLKLTKNKKIEIFLNTLNEFGFGEIKFLKYSPSNNKYTFKSANPTFSNLNSKLFKINPQTNNEFDFFIEYSLKGFIQSLDKKEVTTESYEKSDGIYFNIKVKEKLLDKKINHLTNKNSSNKNNLNSMLKRIIINKQLKLNNGVISIWGITLIALPIKIFELSEITQDEKIMELFENIGKTQGLAAYQVIVNKFGNRERDPYEIFKNIFLQTELIGVGETKIIKFNSEEKQVEINFKEEIIICKGEITALGKYLLGLFSEVLSQIYKQEFKYELKKENLIFTSTNKEHKNSKEIEEFSKYMDINAITKK